LLLSCAAAAAAAQTAQTGGQPRDFVTGYLAQKQAEFQQVDRNLRATERLQARDGLLAVIRAQNPLRRERIAGEGAKKDQVENALLQTLANYLASVGFLPNDVQALRKAGVDIIQAASNGLFGTASSADEAAVSEAVVLARVDRRSDDTAPNDGLGSTLFVTVEKSYKGPYSAGQTLRIRQFSGSTGAVEGDWKHARTAICAFRFTDVVSDAHRLDQSQCPERLVPSQSDGSLSHPGWRAARDAHWPERRR
jgi:hypothetical protein